MRRVPDAYTDASAFRIFAPCLGLLPALQKPVYAADSGGECLLSVSAESPDLRAPRVAQGMRRASGTKSREGPALERGGRNPEASPVRAGTAIGGEAEGGRLRLAVGGVSRTAIEPARMRPKPQ